MYPKHSSSRLVCWLAIAVMALNALWPLLASARPAGAPSFTEICTATGMQLVAGDPVAPSGDSDSKHLQEHCPLCALGADRLLAPPATPSPFFLPQSGPSGLAEFVPAARLRSDILAAAQPRGPPRTS